jgi:hypothetical protein
MAFPPTPSLINFGKPFNPGWLPSKGIVDKQATIPREPEVLKGGNTQRGSGTYAMDGSTNNKQDTVEFKNQNNIFAQVDTDKNDTVKLDGKGWKKVEDPGDKRKDHAVYLNKKTNSAVIVDGGAKVELGDKKPDAKKDKPKGFSKEGEKSGGKLSPMESFKLILKLLPQPKGKQS